MNKNLNSMIVLGISILFLTSSFTFVGGVQQYDPEPEAIPLPETTGTTVYHTWEEMLAELNQTVIDHPDIVKIISIGKTWENRDIWAVKISDNPEIEEPDEPEVYINSNHHAREWLTIEIALFVIRCLTDNYSTNSTITDIVDNRQVWVIPCMNPDGRIHDSAGDDPAVHAVPGNWGWRKNARDNNGGGFDMDYDGVDLNRNYGYMWGSSGASSDPTSYTYGGPSGFSEPESQAVRDFARQHDFVFAISWHTYSQLILYPWGWTFDNAPDHDVMAAVADEMSARMTNKAGSAYPGYVPQKSSGLYPTAGSDDDWLYGELGIYAYCIEGYPNLQDWYDGDPWVSDPYDPFHPHESKVIPACEDNLPAAIYLCQIADNPFQVMDHVEISTIDETLVIDQGTSDATGIDVLNNGQRDDDFTVATSTIPGWSISALPANHNILRNQTAQPTLSITVPGAETPGEYTIWVNVSSDSNSTCTDSCQVTVIVPYSDDVGVDSIAPFLEQGTYPLGEYRIDGTVKNYGEFQVPSFDTSCTITRFGGGTNYNLFSDDMESGMAKWIETDWDGGVTDDYWHIVNTRSNSPSNSMWCGPAGGGIYDDYVTQFLELTDTIDLRNASTATLTYWSSFDVENTYDFCMVEGSADGGQTWEFIARYTGTQIAWIESIHDLSNFTGSTEFNLRFRFTSDGGVGEAGFWLDDVSVDAFIPGETIVFGPASLPTSGPLDPQNSEALQWQYDFDIDGTYRVEMVTSYPADGNPANDLLDVIFDIDPNSHLPDFAGVDAVVNPGTGDSLDISWAAANDPNAPITYSLYRFDHEPNEADVNASSPIWTGTALSYNDAGLTVGQTYYYLVRAADVLGQEEWNMVIANDTPIVLLFFQVQSPFAGYRNLNSDPFETGIQISASPQLAAASQYRIGDVDDHWVSQVYASPQDMTGTWNFNIWGQTSNDLANGYLYARVYRHSDNFLLFQTGNDDEDINLYTSSHEFSWQYDVSGVTLPAGDRFYVEVWLDITSGGGAGQFGETVNPDFTGNANGWTYNGWEDTGGGDATGTWVPDYVNISLTAPTTGGSAELTYSGYWEQAFTTGFAPVVADLSFDWEIFAIGNGDRNLIAYAFIETASGPPTIGSEVWSEQITSPAPWIGVGPIDVSGIVGDGTYYLKMALRDTDLARGEGMRSINLDNVKVNYSLTPPIFTFDYDHQSTPSSVGVSLTPIGGGITYDIDLTGVSADTWVFVSYPITSSGSPTTIFDDAAHGDANTTWDIIRWYDCNDTFDNWKSYDKNYPGIQDLTFADNTMGFWLHITANNGDQVLSTGLGFQPATTSIILKAGWNLVGYPSDTPSQADATLPIQVTKIAVYNVAATPYLIEELPLASVTMTGGNAYWVYTPVVVQWDIDW
ncbi:MAG: immune inhibitor A [Thermoplasmata archaeon]|nr:immune inhibitor A [Thermoplasmata archaeon]